MTPVRFDRRSTASEAAHGDPGHGTDGQPTPAALTDTTDVVDFDAAPQAGCLFCEVPDEHVLLTTRRWIVRWDQHPATPGHALLVPSRHVVSYLDLDDAEQAEQYPTLLAAVAVLDDMYAPDAWNIGVNDGRVAGRTVDHVHIHLIPRYQGDATDPRGGIRRGLPGGAPPDGHRPAATGPTGHVAIGTPGVGRSGPGPLQEGPCL